MEIPPTPRPSFNEEEALANNRRFILSLIEAKEATQIFEMHTVEICNEDKYKHSCVKK